MKHFQHDSNPIGETPDHPMLSKDRISGFRQSDISDLIFIAYDKESNSPIMSHFYYTKCKKWFSFWSSIGNIKSHLKYKHGLIEEDLCQVNVTHAIYSFILTNGLPFRLIEDEHLSKLLTGPVSRKKLANDCDRIAAIVDSNISKRIQELVTSIDVFDEWTDNTSRPYLGITLHGIHKNPDDNFDHQVIVVAHIPLNEIRITHEILSEAITERFEALEAKIPDFFATDAGSKCEPAIEDLCATRKEFWGHALNLVLKDIHNELKERLPLVFSVQVKYGKQPSFRSYMESIDAPYRTIPSYVETRFYSLWKLFEVVNELFDSINEFGLEIGVGELLPDEYRPYIECANSLLTIFKDFIQKLESEKFGSISYVLPGIKMIQASSQQFLDNYPELYVIFDGSYLKHIDPILSLSEKKKDLIVASILNPSIHHPSFFNSEEMEIGYEAIKEELPAFIDIQNSSQPFKWSNFSPPRNTDPIEVYERIAESWTDDSVDLNDFWLANPRKQLEPLVPVSIKYLLPPATNTSSERLFSKARNVLSLNRLCIGHERASNAVICAANPGLINDAISEIIESE